MSETPIDPSCQDRDAREVWMRRAIELAARGEGLVEPNPMVGCVLVRDGQIIGEGYHQRFGGPHAEVEALRSCDDASGATAYVTLEPCCHQGKTPPCSNALIAAGVSRVVVAVQDPFPKVAGGGIRQLNDAGIDVDIGCLREQSENVMAPYLMRVNQARPWVIAKWAMTIDGRIATRSGSSQWVTNAESRQAVHQLRGRVDAVIAGMGTVESDDPLLTARLDDDESAARLALRVVCCLHRLPAVDSRLVMTASQWPVLCCVGTEVDPKELAELRRRGVGVFAAGCDDAAELVRRSLTHLADRQCTNVMVEGGGGLLASFFEAGLVDECHVYLGPKVVGGLQAIGPVGGVGVEAIEDAYTFGIQSIDRFGDDVRVRYRKRLLV